MANNVRIFLTGQRDIDRKLRTMEPRLARKVSRQASRAAIKLVAGAAKTKLKASQSKTQGRDERGRFTKHHQLLRSIKVRALKRTRSGFGHRLVSGGDGRGLAYYGRFVELGTKHQRSQRYMRSSLYDNATVILGYFRASLRAFIAGEKAPRLKLK